MGLRPKEHGILPYAVLGGKDELCEIEGDDEEGVPLFASTGNSRSKLPIPITCERLSDEPAKEADN